MKRGEVSIVPLEAFGCAAALVSQSGEILAVSPEWTDLRTTPELAGPRVGEGASLAHLGAAAPSGWPLKNLAGLVKCAVGGERPGPVMSACAVDGEARWFETAVTPAGEGRALVVHRDVTHVRGTDAALRRVLEQTLFLSGDALFQTLARTAAEVVGTAHAVVGQLLASGDRIRVLAWWNGAEFVQNVEYPIAQTPCQDVVSRGFCLFPSNVQELFPSDEILTQLGVKSYAGVPMLGPDHLALGHVVVMHDGPFARPVDPQFLAVIAARAAAELRRMNAERALWQSQERLRLALDGSRDGVFDWDLKSGRVAGNPSLWEALGYQPEELPTVAAWKGITHPDDFQRVRDALRAHVAGNTPRYSVELRLRAKDASWRWVLQRGTVVERSGDGRALRMTGVQTDLSERKEMEAQVAASARLASIGTLTAGLAHEVNTPLTYLSTGLESLSRGLPPLLASAPPRTAQPILEALEIAREGSLRVQQTVRDIKSFSRGANEDAQELDVREVVAQALRLARHELVRKAQVVEALGEVPRVRANPLRLGQVFLNLLINAAQAIDHGAPHRNEVRLSTFTDAQGRAVVEVRDTGAGIPDDVARHLFDPFFTTKRAGEGTGLGLWICHQIVKPLGGEITFASEPGRGTRFTVTLPAASDARFEAPPRSRRRGRLLVVDDHVAIGTSLKLFLANEHDVVTVTSGNAALEALSAGNPFDLVLCDLVMPDTSGIELFRLIEQRQPQLADRVVFMTGGTFSPEQSAFVQDPRHVVLEKPFPPEQVRQLLLERTGAARSA